LREQGCLGEAEQRVEEHEPGFVEIHQGPGVGAPLFFELQEAGPVGGADHIPETGRLDQIAVVEVDGQAADDARRVEVEMLDRPTPIGEALPDVAVGALLPLLHPVVDQGVVHVVADGPDLAQVQGAVPEDAALSPQLAVHAPLIVGTVRPMPAVRAMPCRVTAMEGSRIG